MEKILQQIPLEVSKLHSSLRGAGFEAYLVGGCVRDLLLSLLPKDWDITTNATPEQIQSLFDETFYENEYGTVGVVTKSDDPRLKVVEITPYRIEGVYTDARRPDHVKFSDKLEDDLKRRDFTINAIALDPVSGQMVDLHNGREDLKSRRINTVGDPSERFKEDALRMLRAIRISAELDFAIENKTAEGIAANANQLQKISRERIRDELLRILMSPRPMQALYVAQKLGILKYVIPELKEGIGVAQNQAPSFYVFEHLMRSDLSPRPMQALYVAQKLGILKYVIPELKEGIGVAQNQAHSFDVFEHLMRSLQHAADKNWPLTVRLAALLHDIGKPASRRWSDEKKD